MNKKRAFAAMLAVMMTASTVLPTTPVMAAGKTDSFEAAQEEKLATSEMKYRPYARWWLAEGSHTDTTLKESIKELYDAGFGGVEFVTLMSETAYLDDATYGWGSPEWIHDSKLIISECEKYGMSVSMTGGSYWATANLPKTAITPDDDAASKELGYKAVELKGTEGTNTSYNGVLPECTLPGDATKQDLVTVVAAKVVSWGDDSSKTKFDTDSLTVVKDKVTANEDGTYSIDYTAEDDGDYILFAFYMYGTSESYTASCTGVNYTINYLDPVGAETFIDYWNSTVLTEDMQDIINGIEECNLYMDSLELATEGADSTKQLWCKDMLDEFQSRRSYSLEKYLPLMIRETVDGISGMAKEIQYVYDNTDSSEISIKALRNDFFQTETELYEENCLKVLDDWLHTKNMKLRAEPSYGKTMEVSQTVDSIDYLETESFEFAGEIDSYRNFAGAAHIYNKRLSSETGAAIFTNYRYNNGYYRQIMYSQYVSGIQKTVTHGYSSQYGTNGNTAWPGFEGMTNMISERFNKRQPGFVDYAEVNAHLSRIQEVLEQGVPQMDILMLRTDYYLNNLLTGVSNKGIMTNRLHNRDAYYWRDLELQDAGYTYDYVSPYVLTDTDMSDGMVNSDGVAYKAVVVMENELPLAAAQKLLEGAKAGLPILFVNNVVEDVNNDHVMRVNTVAGSTTGSNDGKDAELAEVVAQIKACANVKTVDSTADAMEALQSLNVTPRAGYAESNAKILTTMRKADDATYLLVYNYMFEDTEDYVGQINVEGSYKAYELNTWSGDVTEVTNASTADGYTTLNVDVAPGEVVLYVLDPKGTSTYKADTNTYYTMDLTSWDLSVDSYTPGERVERTETTEETGVTTTEETYVTNHTILDAGTLTTPLAAWKDIEAVGETVSGVGTYTTTFTLPENWDGSCELILKADSFNYGTARVEINGQQVPVNMDAAEADLAAYAKAGENTLSVRVTSSLNNVGLATGIWWLNTNSIGYAPYGMTGNVKLTSTTPLTEVDVLKAEKAELEAEIAALKAAIAAVKFAAKKTTISAVKTGKKYMYVSVKKVSGADGYKIRYARTSSMKNAKSVVTTATKKLIKVAKSGKYYVQARAYKKIAGVKVYTIYGAKKAVTVK